MSDIKVGAIFRDRDKRMSSGRRHVRVEGIVGDFAICRSVSADGSWSSTLKPTRIRLTNLRKRFEALP